MFERRAGKGQCVNQPYLGCREFAARFRWIPDPEAEPVDRSLLDERSRTELGFGGRAIWATCCTTWISPIRTIPSPCFRA